MASISAATRTTLVTPPATSAQIIALGTVFPASLLSVMLFRHIARVQCPWLRNATLLIRDLFPPSS
jgi:hypothetical protein